MTLRVHHTPFPLCPPDDLLAAQPALGHAAADLAHIYADRNQFITDEGLRVIGSRLWAALEAADPALGDRLEEARAAAGNRILPLAIESGAAAIQRLPWEALHHPTHGFLGRDPRFALSRRRGGRAPDPDPAESGPLRVLMFTCLPDDLDPEKERLDVEEQQALALEAWGAAVAEGRVELQMPDDGRFSTFARLIKEHDPHLVFLFTHGRFIRPQPGAANQKPHAVALFEGEDGRGDAVDERKLAEVFAGRGTRCVVLAACESGMGDSAELSAGLAWALHHGGLPHVIGMRETILAAAAMRFNAAFGALALAGERVDAALQRAREAITRPLDDDAIDLGGNAGLREQSLGQWPLPALLSHSAGAPLVDWDFTPQPPPERGGSLLWGVRVIHYIRLLRRQLLVQIPFNNRK